MFVLTVIEDKIKTTPDQFDQDLTDVLLKQIEMKFCNKARHDQ
jgi:DNA-directed RNA polymerase subunit E'/Rpb7